MRMEPFPLIHPVITTHPRELLDLRHDVAAILIVETFVFFSSVRKDDVDRTRLRNPGHRPAWRRAQTDCSSGRAPQKTSAVHHNRPPSGKQSIFDIHS